MNRVKFRVWDKTNNRMHPVSSIYFRDDGRALTIVVELAPKGQHYNGLVDGENGMLMQWTGLTDNNGDDIYEGDIVRVRKPNSYLVGDYIVAWHAHHCQFAWKRIIPLSTGEEWAMMGANRPYSLNQRDKEVIGNIYQTPHLVEQAK